MDYDHMIHIGLVLRRNPLAHYMDEHHDDDYDEA
jgi:hypothetical protein